MAVDALLRDKVALITGAGNGIGAAGAELFASEGAAVFVVDIDGDAATSVAQRIEADLPVSVHHVDLVDRERVVAATRDVAARFDRAVGLADGRVTGMERLS